MKKKKIKTTVILSIIGTFGLSSVITVASVACSENQTNSSSVINHSNNNNQTSQNLPDKKQTSPEKTKNSTTSNSPGKSSNSKKSPDNNSQSSSSNSQKQTKSNPSNKSSADQPDTIINNTVCYALDWKKHTAIATGFKKNVEQTTSNFRTLIIPATINVSKKNFAVVGVANGAFFNSQITQLTLPNTMTTIGADAFANNFLQTLVIPQSVLNIGNNAFSNNPFNYDTVIYLNKDCVWNKSSALCPFPNSDNYSKFAPQISFVIQNQAVYQWQPNQNGWVVTSYMPSVQNEQITGYTLQKSNNTDTDSFDSNYSQANYQISSLPNINWKNFFFSDSLATNFVQIGNANAGLSFNPTTMTMQFIQEPDAGSVGSNGTISLYNPTSQKMIINTQIGSNTSYSKLASLIQQNKTFQNGDILTVNGNLASNINIFSNFCSLQDVNNPNNALYSGLHAWEMYTQQLSVQFMITPYGLIPYTNLTHVNPLQVLDGTNSTAFCVTGTTIPNQKVTVEINNQTFIGTASNNGYFSVAVTKQNNITPSTIVTVATQMTPPVQTHLLGNNPVNSAILMNVNNFKFSILFNGITHKLQVYDQGAFANAVSLFYPLFTNPSFFASDTPNLGNISQTQADNYQIGAFNSNTTEANFDFTINLLNDQKLVHSYQINVTKTTTVQELINQIQIIPYTNNTTYEFIIPADLNSVPAGNSGTVNVSEILNNNTLAPMGEAQQKTGDNPVEYVGTTSYKFLVNNNGITNLLNTQTEINNVNQYNSYYEPYNAIFSVTNHSLISLNHQGIIMTGGNVGNFYNPSQLMQQVADTLTKNVTTSYEKALAIYQFVHQNMTYSASYSYGNTIQGTFKHLTGICGNYSGLTCVLCSLVGIVSRIITGQASLEVNPWPISSATNHAWIQIWSPDLKEWLTLDPTYGWSGPYGQLQSRFNYLRGNEQVAVVFWPKGTNYFSYFKGAEWEALNHLADYFGIAQGRPAAEMGFKNAIIAAKLLNLTQQLPTVSLYYQYNKNFN